jgi:hypothetical protein
MNGRGNIPENDMDGGVGSIQNPPQGSLAATDSPPGLEMDYDPDDPI